MKNQFIIQEYDNEDTSQIHPSLNLVIVTGKIISFFDGRDWWFSEAIDKEVGTEEFQYLRKQSIIEILPKDEDCLTCLLSTGGLNLYDKKVINHCFLINVKLEDKVPYFFVSLGYPDMLTKRSLHNTLNIDNKYFLAIGGKNDSGWLKDCEVFNQQSKKWEAFPSMICARSNFDSVILNKKIFVYGGFSLKECFSEILIEYCEFNTELNKNKWEAIKIENTSLPLACSKLFKYKEDKLLIIGGCDKTKLRNEVYEFDYVNNQIGKVTELKNGRTNFHLLPEQNNLFILGGSFKYEFTDKNGTTISNYIEKIDLKNLNTEKDITEYNMSYQLEIVNNLGNKLDQQYYDPGFSLSASLLLKEIK